MGGRPRTKKLENLAEFQEHPDTSPMSSDATIALLLDGVVVLWSYQLAEVAEKPCHVDTPLGWNSGGATAGRDDVISNFGHSNFDCMQASKPARCLIPHRIVRRNLLHQPPTLLEVR